MADRRRKPRITDPGLLGRRAAGRARIVLPASVETVHGRIRIALLNLSRTGAMVEAPGLPGVGNDVILKCGDIDALGIVVWSGNGRCGIEFDEQIDEHEVIRLRRAGDETARTGVTPEQRQAAEDWTHGRTR
jgi:PilZ domain